MSSGRPNSIVIPIVAYMTANPGESLTADDMVVKFGFKDRTTPYPALRRLVREGWVTKKSGKGRRGFGSLEFSAGPQILKFVDGAE